MYKLYSNYVFKNLSIMGFVFLGSIVGFLLTSIFITRVQLDKEALEQYLVSSNNDNRLYFDADQVLIENGRVSEVSLYASSLEGEFEFIFNYDPAKLSLLDVQFADTVKNPIFAKDLNKKAFLLSGEIKKDSRSNKLLTILLQPIDNKNSQISLNCLDSSFWGLQSLKSQSCALKVDILNKNLTIDHNTDNCDVLQIRPPKIVYINSNQNGDGIDLVWEKESGDQSVSIFYKQVGESSWSVAPNIKTQNAYQINELNPEKSYLIKAFSSNRCVQSDFSDTHLVALNKENKPIITGTVVARNDSNLRKTLFYKTVVKIAYFSELNKLVYVLIFLILSLGWFSVWLMSDFLKNINNININNKY